MSQSVLYRYFDGRDALVAAAGAAIIGAVRAMIGEALVRTPPADQRAVVAAALNVGAAMLGIGELIATRQARTR